MPPQHKTLFIGFLIAYYLANIANHYFKLYSAELLLIILLNTRKRKPITPLKLKNAALHYPQENLQSSL